MEPELADDTPVYPIRDVRGAPQEKAEEPVEQPLIESTLRDMQRKDGFKFFTPVLIMSHGRLDRDPVAEFERTHQTNDPAMRVFSVDLEDPLFIGLPRGSIGGQPVDWNRRLYGVVGENWEQCKSFIGALSGYDIKSYHYFKVGTYELQVVDPTSPITLGELPFFEVTVFCASTNRGFAWIAPAKQPPVDLPRLRLDLPQQDVLVEAAALLGPPPTPEAIHKFRKG